MEISNKIFWNFFSHNITNAYNFLFRYTQNPSDLMGWFEEYLDDEEVSFSAWIHLIGWQFSCLLFPLISLFCLKISVCLENTICSMNSICIKWIALKKLWNCKVFWGPYSKRCKLKKYFKSLLPYVTNKHQLIQQSFYFYYSPGNEKIFFLPRQLHSSNRRHELNIIQCWSRRWLWCFGPYKSRISHVAKNFQHEYNISFNRSYKLRNNPHCCTHGSTKLLQSWHAMLSLVRFQITSA